MPPQSPDTQSDHELLLALDLFHSAPPEIVGAVAHALRTHRVEADTPVLAKGEAGDRMYIIREGSVKIHDGDIIVAVLKRGELFGEFSIIDSEPRSMDVSTIEDTVLLSIGREEFLNILRSNADAPFSIMTMLVKRLREQSAAKLALFKVREEELQRLVAERTADLRERNEELAKALARLTTTQEQLLQAEKLASLGELTAGIAHEIQNPLNFVNNFSELSMELIEDTELALSEAARDGTADQMDELRSVLVDLKRNNDKIREHGRRADRIIKGMLLHVRSGPVEFSPTDLNAMIEQDVSLAYHGWRAKDSSFAVSFKKSFDPDVGEVNLVQPDVSRVLINLFNNAMYAMRDRRRYEADDYKPTLEVSTVRQVDNVEIRIRDNGAGIPEDMRDKLFQPFTTSKPTGEGTGLGLSISYEIITKGHRGRLSVESEAGVYTEFVISIPLTL